MIVKDLKQTGRELKWELQNNSSPETAKKIAFKIENATHQDGTPLSVEEKEHILKYIEFPIYDHETGQGSFLESDNSEFLKLVAIIAKNIKGGK